MSKSKSVLTLIAPSDKEKLTSRHLGRVENKLTQEGALLITSEWLAPDIACDLMFTHMEPARAEELAQAALMGAPVDCIAQETEDRQKRLLVADMDSTIITIECIDELADFAGVKPQVAMITERAMRGEIDFAAALQARVELLKDLPESVLQRVWDERVRFTPGARELVASMRAQGAYTVLISGGFDFFTSRVREELGFHADVSNRLEAAGGKLTGNVIQPILDRNTKLHTLLQCCAERGISTQDALAVGDGANDIPMLVAAGLGIAYHAKPAVQQSARARLNHCDLSAVLYAQGYRQDEIVKVPQAPAA